MLPTVFPLWRLDMTFIYQFGNGLIFVNNLRIIFVYESICFKYYYDLFSNICWGQPYWVM